MRFGNPLFHVGYVYMEFGGVPSQRMEHFHKQGVECAKRGGARVLRWYTTQACNATLKGSIRHHGLDLVDRLGVPYRRLRRHAARRVGRARTEGEGTRLASRNPSFNGAPDDRKRASSVRRASANRPREPLRSSFPMSKNEGFVPDGRGQLMADIAPSRNARLAAHLAAHLALLHGRDVP